MERGKGGFIVVLCVVVVAFVFFISLFFDRMAGTKQQVNKDKEVAARIADGEDYSYHIYWIGECPEYLTAIGDRLTILDAESVNEETMPIPWVDNHTVIYDRDGEIIQEIFPRDYADHMLIVVRNGVGLTTEQYEIIRTCVSDNGVDMLLMGDNISPYREILCQAPGMYEEYDTYLYSDNLGLGINVVDQATQEDSREFTKYILDLMYRICDAEIIEEATATTTYETVEPLETTEEVAET